jgi:chromosome segregation ATPase
VRGTPVPKTATPGTSNPGGGKPGNASAEQRARDSDSRIILETELKKAEAKLAEQQKEYNNGEPEKQDIEGRNYQRYLDRVAELKESISRQQSDIAGLKRELARLPAPAASAP